MILEELNCPPYLPDRSYLEEEEESEFFDFEWLEDLFRKERDSTEKTLPRRRRSGGNEKIRKQNERLERKRRRQKKRKKFFDKVKRRIN